MKNKIREVRKEKEMTQQDLVEDLDITKQYISLIERNEEVPSLNVANAIANVLDVCIYKIFDLDGEETYHCKQCECCN